VITDEKMRVQADQEHREKLKALLADLAKSPINMETEKVRTEFYERLEECYHNPHGPNYRHYYSDIFSTLTWIHNGLIPGDLRTLLLNISVIHGDYDSYNHDDEGNLINVRDCVDKLYDHVNLDISRIEFANAGDRATSHEAKIDELKRNVNSLSSGIEKAQKDLGDTRDELRDSKKEYISILGIFSSVVLTFTADIAFSTSVLENIHQASVYRLVLGILLIAFVLINTIFLLFHYVDKMVHGEDEKGLSFIKWINKAIAGTMIVVVALWLGGLVEWRNSRYDEKPQNDEQATPTIANMTEEQLEEKIEEILNETMENTVDVDITINGESENVQNKEAPQTGE